MEVVSKVVKVHWVPPLNTCFSIPITHPIVTGTREWPKRTSIYPHIHSCVHFSGHRIFLCACYSHSLCIHFSFQSTLISSENVLWTDCGLINILLIQTNSLMTFPLIQMVLPVRPFLCLYFILIPKLVQFFIWSAIYLLHLTCSWHCLTFMDAEISRSSQQHCLSLKKKKKKIIYSRPDKSNLCSALSNDMNSMVFVFDFIHCLLWPYLLDCGARQECKELPLHPG